MNLVSVVTVAIKKNGEFLLIPKRVNRRAYRVEKVTWGFPSDEFKENLNGNLDDTVRRVLENIVTDDWQDVNRAEYLGSYIRTKENKISIGYNFLIENFKGEIKAKKFKWVEEDYDELDRNSLTFLKFNKGLF